MSKILRKLLLKYLSLNLDVSCYQNLITIILLFTCGEEKFCSCRVPLQTVFVHKGEGPRDRYCDMNDIPS